MNNRNPNQLNRDQTKISEVTHSSPFSVLGRHQVNDVDQITVYMPFAESVQLGEDGPAMQRLSDSDFFVFSDHNAEIANPYLLKWIDKNGDSRENYDPYNFGMQMPEFDQHLFCEGKHWHIYKKLGANLHSDDDVKGVLFAVWAPNAERVSVIGDFNRWDGRCHAMRSLGSTGIWEIFIPSLGAGELYKFEILNRYSKDIFAKTDPYSKQFELRPDTSSVVSDGDSYQWQDQAWMKARQQQGWLHQPCSVYEVHLGSWRRDSQGNFLNYRDVAKQLVDYVSEVGFTHIELLPITEHPLDASWGYQATGYFAPSSRFGLPDDFRYFVDYCHQNNVGVILDWVPAHFPKDFFALAKFDGSSLYEHEDPRQGEHRDWGTLIFNLGRNEVKNFLLASAVYWLEEYHLDGLRVDAVASMLYLDYSRENDDWIPNKHGGNENLEAIEFFRELNSVTHSTHPGAMIIAEESTSWPQVTQPTDHGGLGFSMKWNMGWMHDILVYMGKDPVHRVHHHDQLTFGLLYAFNENFMLPFSHDEVVHGKGSLLSRMPGDEWQQFANLRLLYTMMFTYPGKKLLFMGCEFGQGVEWNFNKELDWYVLDYPFHKGLQTLVKDLNQIHKQYPALHQYDFEQQGFEWLEGGDAQRSVLCYTRKAGDDFVVVALNFTPVPRNDYRVGVPQAGVYQEILNSDEQQYQGSGVSNAVITSKPIEWMSREQSISLNIPPLAGVVLKMVDAKK